jgi:TolB-like protein/class 3 adenylate cyclase/Flp pilus assembly protein TadD
MPTDSSSDAQLELAHVLFIDIVGYSKRLVNEQTTLVKRLNELVLQTEQCRKADAAGKLIRIPTGDGVALAFFTSPDAPVRCAMELSKADQADPKLELRMGIHTGPVDQVSDVNQRSNITGAGINMAQRVMDCGDAGHILLSKHIAEDLEQYGHWRPLLHDLGECEAKHGVRVSVVSLYGDGIGNRQLPKKFLAFRKRRARMRWMAIASGLLLLAAIVPAFLVITRKAGVPVTAPEKSIAVLPFENLSEDKANTYFADGIQYEILTRLSKIADLKVISRTSTQHYKSAPENLPEIARQLGVAHVVEGSVQKSGDAVRVNVELIRAANDSHLWADTFDRKVTDIFSVETEIAKTIADQLRAKLTGQEEQSLAAKPTNNPDAYDAFLRGLAFSTHSVYSDEPIRQAISFFEKATELDPNFALAWARLSRAKAFLYFRESDTTTECREAAKRALENAQKLQPNSPDTLLALGYYQYWMLRDFGLATRTFMQISEMLPSNSDVPFALGAIFRRQGRWNESIASLERGLVVDPRNSELVVHTADTYVMVRNFAAALRLYNRALDIVPNDPDLLITEAGIYQALGDLKQAAEMLSGLNARTPTPDSNPKIITQLLLERDQNKAVRLLQAQPDRSHFGAAFYERANWVNLAFVQRLAGDETDAKLSAEQARNALEPLCRSQPDNAILAAHLSQAYAALDMNNAALKEAERATALLPTAKDAVDGPGLEENLALVEMLVGENSQAISTLSRVLRTPYDGWYYITPVTPALLRLDPTWDRLRTDSAFQKLCEAKP